MRLVSWSVVGLMIAAAMAAWPSCAHAEHLSPGDGWHVFSWFEGVGSQNSEGPFTFSSRKPVVLEVTDSFLVGDQFQVFDGATSLGTTSLPVSDGTKSATKASDAFLNPKYSHGTFVLPPGTHSISLQTIQTAGNFTSGVGYLRVESCVKSIATPEPATLSLALLTALGTIGIAGVRRCFAMQAGSERPR